jgi:general secretion pathway protein A
MVLDYYGLREQPFGVTPDSRYLFLSASHHEALASLLYGIEAGRGFIALIARPGMGKTTLLFHALNHLRSKATTIFLFQTIATPLDLLRAILSELGVRDMPGSLAETQLRLNELLVEQARLGKRVVVVIDEAQNLEDSVLEQVRMLSNFETSREKLIQIVLSGQPQLAEKIASPALVQLRQRISMFGRLDPFSSEATGLYIQHRLRAAGYELATPLFTGEALALIFQYSEGIPRNINNLCFNSLSLGCVLKRKAIDADVVREVVSDLDLDRWRPKTSLALRPEASRLQEAPPFLLTSNEPAISVGGIPRLVWAVAALVLICGALFASRWILPKASVQMTPRAAQHPAVAGPSSNQSQARVIPAETATQADEVTPSAPAAPGPSSNQNPLPITPTESAPQADSAVSQVAPVAPPSTGASQNPQVSAAETTINVTPGRTLLGICVENFGSCNPQLLQEIRKLNPGLSNLDHIEPGQKIRLPVSEAVVEKPVKASTVQSDTP